MIVNVNSVLSDKRLRALTARLSESSLSISLTISPREAVPSSPVRLYSAVSPRAASWSISSGLILERNISTPAHAIGLTTKRRPMSGYMKNAVRLPVSTIMAVPKWFLISLSETCLVMPSPPTIPCVIELRPGGMSAVTAPWTNLTNTMRPRLVPYSCAVPAVMRVSAVVATLAPASSATLFFELSMMYPAGAWKRNCDMPKTKKSMPACFSV
mmetsp:Transcript_33573/g.76675  ORF Transcript_33573/g.76675 Transcript_33573/m.76675 type:complete len:213 (+) Transcript_33573:1392-2030(+)